MFGITQITSSIQSVIFIKFFSLPYTPQFLFSFFNLKQMNSILYNYKTQFLLCNKKYFKRFIYKEWIENTVKYVGNLYIKEVIKPILIVINLRDI